MRCEQQPLNSVENTGKIAMWLSYLCAQGNYIFPCFFGSIMLFCLCIGLAENTKF